MGCMGSPGNDLTTDPDRRTYSVENHIAGYLGHVVRARIEKEI